MPSGKTEFSFPPFQRPPYPAFLRRRQDLPPSFPITLRQSCRLRFEPPSLPPSFLFPSTLLLNYVPSSLNAERGSSSPLPSFFVARLRVGDFFFPPTKVARALNIFSLLLAYRSVGFLPFFFFSRYQQMDVSPLVCWGPSSSKRENPPSSFLLLYKILKVLFFPLFRTPKNPTAPPPSPFTDGYYCFFLLLFIPFFLFPS